jgi:hypothetical protein
MNGQRLHSQKLSREKAQKTQKILIANAGNKEAG